MIMSTRPRRKFNRSKRKGSFNGSKTEFIRKPIPRISTVNKKVKKLADMIEVKRVDTFFNAVVANDGTSRLLMNGIAVGTGALNRIGNEVIVTSVQFRAHIIANTLSVDPTRLRCIVFWDRQANDANPATATFVSSQNSLLDGAVITVPQIMPYNYFAMDRYRVIYDKTFTLNPKVVSQSSITGGQTTTDEVGPVSLSFKKKIKLNRRVKYNGAAGDITDIQTNSLFAVFYAVEDPTLQFGARVYYKDA